MNYIKKSNKTEKTAEYMCPTKKGGSSAFCITLSCTWQNWSKLPLLSLAKPFVTAHHIALTRSPVAAYPVSRQVGRA